MLPYPTILAHKSALTTSLAPQIDTLISKAESHIGASSGKIQRLEERLGILQSARLPVLEELRTSIPKTFADGLEVEEQDVGGAGEERYLDGLEMRELSVAQRRKVVMLKGKRERLDKERAKLLGQAS